MAKKPRKSRDSLLATGGGNATAGGVSFQASVAAFLAAQALADAPADARLSLGAAKATAFRFETEAPVDDILVAMDSGGWAFIQAKNSLTNSASLTSELGKTCLEFARLWEAASAGTGERGWNRPLAPATDVLVIAVGPRTSGTIKHDLAQALDLFRSGSTATVNAAQRKALTRFRSLLRAGLTSRGGVTAAVNPDDIFRLVHVIEFDFGGGHRTAGEALMGNALENPTAAPAALATLAQECERRMTARNGITLDGLRRELARSGVAMRAPAEFHDDIAALEDRTSRVARALNNFERTAVNGADVTIRRACTTACVAAAGTGSLVIVGDPGTGKSAVISEAARQLQANGHDVILLAVDRLQVESTEGLSGLLGIAHPLPTVLANWPGAGPAYLVLDALDACRFGQSEALFRTLMQDVLETEGGRWRVIASIRTFDLMVGQEFRRLFRGAPPDPAYVDQRFQNVRHLRIPEWSDAEFEELLTRIPALRVAIDGGGPKLAELARVPFNTRLLAELLSAGVAPGRFSDLHSQVQLLELYWNERIRPLGAPAEQCLRNIVEAMIARGRMEASRVAVAGNTGNALDQLLQSGALASVNGDRDVAFSHHILFDYVASRVAIDVDDPAALQRVLANSGASLLLAPALSFALQHLWETSGTDRSRFWTVLAQLAGDTSGDPIARSVAARAGCDLPAVASDVAGLVAMMRTAPQREKAFGAFRHIVGSLGVRLEDEIGVPPVPWCQLAADVAPYMDHVAWPTRTLLQSLIDRVDDPALRAQLGTAARALMAYAFDGAGGEGLMPLTIMYVTKTWGTDPSASRQLTQRLLTPERMRTHAANDMHWLSQETKRIWVFDAAFVVEIYDRSFSHTIEEDGPTSLGQSRILQLTSNRKQDFKMAQWGLKEAFPAFAAEHPLAATQAAIRVARAYISNEHTYEHAEQSVVMVVGNQTATLEPDHSYIWAANDPEAYEDDALQLIGSFVAMFRDAPLETATAIARTLLSENRTGWLWHRLFQVGAARGGELRSLLWPWASQVELLKVQDVRKPAIDVVAGEYPQVSAADRIAFERAVITATFPNSNEPAQTALRFQRRIFGAIGVDALETPEACAIVEAAHTSGDGVSNDDDQHLVRDIWFEREDFAWLTERGVDVAHADNAGLLEAIAALDNALSNQTDATPDRLPLVVSLTDALIAAPAGAHALVIAHGWEKLAWALARITYQNTAVAALTPDQKSAITAALAALNTALPGVEAADAKMAKRARENTAGTMMNMARLGADMVALFRADLERFASDPAEGVRAEIANKLAYLWDPNRELLWSLVDGFARSEVDARTLISLVNFLIRAANHAADRIGETAQVLLHRTDIPEAEARDHLREGFGTLIFHLWLRHTQPTARATIDDWLNHRGDHKAELRHAVFSMRESLVLGYENSDQGLADMRGRAQALAFEVIDRTARAIEDYMALDRADQTEALVREVSDDAALLEQASDQFFFAVGAPEVRQGRAPRALGEVDYRRRYVEDNRRTFMRVGDAATPKAVYYMLQLLEFLEPADPAGVFDMTANALLKAGKMHGYQFESLGADQFVRMIGTMIADHRELFADNERRAALVDVLEIFVEAGWPAARRLLYRLPEALR